MNFTEKIFVFNDKGQKMERRRMSLRHDALRRGSVVQAISKEVPWDIFDRLFLPLIYCQAFAIIFSAAMQFFEIRFAFSTFGIFIIFSLATVTITLFYHNLKVRIYDRHEKSWLFKSIFIHWGLRGLSKRHKGIHACSLKFITIWLHVKSKATD